MFELERNRISPGPAEVLVGAAAAAAVGGGGLERLQLLEDGGLCRVCFSAWEDKSWSGWERRLLKSGGMESENKEE